MFEGIGGGGKGEEEKLAAAKSFRAKVLMRERKRKKGEKGFDNSVNGPNRKAATSRNVNGEDATKNSFMQKLPK